MRQLIEFRLSDGKSIFVEAEPEIRSAERPLSSGDAHNQITKKFDEVAATLGAVAESIDEQLSKLAKAPKKVEVELHATVKAGGKLFIAEGSAEGGIKLRLFWER